MAMIPDFRNASFRYDGEHSRVEAGVEPYSLSPFVGALALCR